MDIDKLIRCGKAPARHLGFGSLMDIDKLIPLILHNRTIVCFGSLMDIDKLIRGLSLACIG